MSLVFVDDKSDGWIFNPVNSNLIKIPDMPATIQGIVWETFEPEKWVFVAYNGEFLYTYIYAKYTVDGPNCLLISKMRQPYSSIPLLLFKGVIVFLDASGKIVQMKLDSHTHDQSINGLSQHDLIEKMKMNYNLKRFDEAYVYATRITNRNELLEFGKSALYHLEIEHAIRIYRLASSPDMVFTLNSIKHIEERNLLCGHILVLLSKFDQAQASFLSSTTPVEALNVKMNLNG